MFHTGSCQMNGMIAHYDRCASKEGEVSSMQEARIDAVNVG